MGCGSESTVAPQPDESPRLVAARADGVASQWGGGAGGGNNNQDGTIRQSAVISAWKGGTLRVGRHKLTFAPRALLRDTEITIVDVTAREGHVACELYPEGIVFLGPVTLETDFSDLADPSGYSMYWLANDSLIDVWMNVGGNETSDGKGIAVTLHHFSEYAPGKAGW
jgi:hypothetical protein